MRILFLTGALAALVLLLASPAAAGRDVIAESPGCGYPRFYLPEAGRSGSLPNDFPIRGPAGALFGRTLQAVRGQLVEWTVPMSDGAVIDVHRRLLPVLADVEENLKQAALGGNRYHVRASDTWGFNARTTVASQAISYHGLGAAIDINATTNPYRRDNRLITDMPGWFVDAWESAGMCWGGNWRWIKDPMHFSWVGPAASPAYDQVPRPVPPLTSPASFAREAGSHPVVFGSSDNPRFVVDASGDGAPDVAHVRPWGEDAVLELATSQEGYEACSIWRWWIEDPPPGRPHLADVEGIGRPDLVYLDESGDRLRLHRYAVGSGYRPSPTLETAAESGGWYAFGDVDRDGADDLWVATAVEAGTRLRIFSAASSYTESLGAGTVEVALRDGTRLATSDRNVDGRADLMVVSPGGGAVDVVLAGALDSVAETVAAPVLAGGEVVGFEDYDGDGRPDLQVLGSDGFLRAWLGNAPLAGLSPTSWFLPPDFDCPDGTLPYFHEGRFADDEESIFQFDIEWLAGAGITKGCNPPFEDRFCPREEVSRGQMAAFLRRALDLRSAPNRFGDDDGSVFEEDIGALAAADITRGCNPPANDRFCPDQSITRGQMAAFLRRALDLPSHPNRFGDDDGSVFEEDIGALAAAGITRGCNPPANDRFCPDRSVTRGEMAAFLHRAIDSTNE